MSAPPAPPVVGAHYIVSAVGTVRFYLADVIADVQVVAVALALDVAPHRVYVGT